MSTVQKRPKYVTCVLPEKLYKPADQLKEMLQDEGVTVTGRQVIGRDGIALASFAWLMAQPEAVQRDIVMKGIALLRSM